MLINLNINKEATMKSILRSEQGIQVNSQMRN